MILLKQILISIMNEARRYNNRLKFKRKTRDIKVSVVIAAYNEEKYILQALNSLVQQSHKNLECIIVNDKSTDCTAQVVADFISDKSNYILINNEKNLGLAGARNVGLYRATGKYICFLDADDIYFKNGIEDRLVSLVSVNESKYCIGSFGGICLADQDLNLKQGKMFRFSSFRSELKSFITSKGECPFNAHAPLLDTECLKQNNGFDVSMNRGAEDWELWIRLMRKAYFFVPTNAWVGSYRQRAQSMVKRWSGEHLYLAEKLLLYCEQEDKSDDIFYQHSYSYYQKHLFLIQRKIVSLVYCFLGNNIEQYDQLLLSLPPKFKIIADIHINYDVTIETSAWKFFGGDSDLTNNFVKSESFKKIKNDIKTRLN